MSRTSPIDNEAIHDLRDELKDLNASIKESSKTTEKFTAAMFVLAMVQMLIALFQLLLTFAYPDNVQLRTWLGIFMVFAALATFAYFFHLLSKKIK